MCNFFFTPAKVRFTVLFWVDAKCFSHHGSGHFFDPLKKIMADLDWSVNVIFEGDLILSKLSVL